MAHKYVVKRKKKSLFQKILPDSVQAFTARRILDCVGIAFGCTGIALLAALLSYSAADPSFNSAGQNESVENWMGHSGAMVSDVLVQALGPASGIFAVAFFVWGISILARRPISPLWARGIALILGTVSAAIALARIPSGGAMEDAYMGGSAGTILLNKITSASDFIFPANSYTGIAVAAGIFGFALLSYAFAMKRDEWDFILSGVQAGIAATSACLVEKFQGFRDWVLRYNDESYEPPIRRAFSRDEEAPRRRAPLLNSDAEEEDENPKLRPPVKAEAKEDYNDEDDEEPQAKPLPIRVPAQSERAVSASRQSRLPMFEGGEWELPTLDLLTEPDHSTDENHLDEKALRMNAEMLQNVLNDYNIKGEIVSIHPGPVVTLYELEPAPGTKTSRVVSLSDDIARSMSAVSVRAAVVAGRNVIGIELPNKIRQKVFLRDLLSTRESEKYSGALPLMLGKDIGGKPIIADLSRMPHLLVAGTTGSGKSVAINTMILSLLFRLPPEKCRFIMIDPKMLELSVYDDIPHLLAPVVTEPGRAVVALKWVVNEMEERYRSMSKLGVRNIDGYNERLREARKKGEVLMRKVQTGFDPETGKPVYEEQPLDLTELPYIVVIVDEFADLMLVAGKDVENAVQRLAQMARAAGIHLIMATQRPSVDVITGVIKANFPTRISFAVTSKIDSRTILGEGGAEQLLGMGDMLYMAAGGRITRVHGPFASDEDVENVVTFLKKQGEPAYLEEITEGGENYGEDGLSGAGGGENVDELYDQAVSLVARERKASTSFIQRHLQIGYNRAARIIEEMERQGVVSQANHVGKREVLVGDYSDVGT